MLLSLYAQASSPVQQRLQALVCLKSLIHKLYVKKHDLFSEGQTKPTADQLKAYLRTATVELLKQEFDLRFRKIINAMFGTIVTSNVNNSLNDLPSLANYFFSEFLQTLSQNGSFVTETALQKLKTIRSCFKVLAQKKLVRNMTPLSEQVFILVQNLTNFITLLDQQFESAQNTGDVLTIRMVKELYMVAMLLVSSGNPSFNADERICQLVAFLLPRIKVYLNVYYSLYGNRPDEMFFAVLEKHAVNIVYHYSDIVMVSPMAFHLCVEDYLNYALSCFQIHWKSQTVRKAVGIQMYRLLKCYMFYTEPAYITEKKLGEKLKVNSSAHKLCNDAFKNVFGNGSVVQGIIQTTISEYFSAKREEDGEVGGPMREEDIENFIEREEKVGLDVLLNEFDASCQLIGSSIFEHTLMRFPVEGLRLYRILLTDIMAGTLPVSDQLADEILSQLVYLKRVYQFASTPVDQQIALLPIFQFLFAKGSANLIYNRRALIILKQMIEESQTVNLQETYPMLLRMLQTDDYIVQFEVLHCLFMIVKSDHESELNYHLLLQAVIPTVIRVIKRFKSSNLIFKIGEQFCNLLSKCQNNIGELKKTIP